jgi:P-type E1-E2 ATPase
MDALQKKGKKTVLLTGDREESALEVGHLLGMDEIFFDLKPKEKLFHIGRMAKDGHLAMVGDGINDAPALSRATVGISMGKGASQVAIDASDAVILREDLSLVKWLFEKACMTRRVILQNLLCALSLMIIASITALLGDLPLWSAVIVHEGGTLLVSLNSLRLLSERNY